MKLLTSILFLAFLVSCTGPEVDSREESLDRKEEQVDDGYHENESMEDDSVVEELDSSL